jgi:dCMP deaminase
VEVSLPIPCTIEARSSAQTIDPILGICAGKHSVAEYLVQQHHFLRLHLPQNDVAPAAQHTEDDRRLLPSVSDERGTRGLTFPDVDSLLDFVTKRWREHWVFTHILSERTLDLLLRRPFFLLISVDAPVTLRYSRFSSRCDLRSLALPPLDQFLLWSDAQLYSGNSDSSVLSSPSSQCHNVARLMNRSHLRILNHYLTPGSLHRHLSSLNLISPSRLRPTWDQYFMQLAKLASTRSNCMKRRVGAVLVRNNRVISTGYNGTPRHLTNCQDGGCARCNGGTSGGEGLNTCLCLHAEENALLEAGRERVGDRGGILYCDTCPCLTCSVKIVQVGIEEVIYAQGYNMDQQAAAILEEGGVTLRQFNPEKGGGSVELAIQREENSSEEKLMDESATLVDCVRIDAQSCRPK